MEIIRAEVLGFCMGVRRAVELALSEGEQSSASVYTYGPLIHNKTVLTALKNLGVEVLEKCEPCHEGSVIIIRAHGISPAEENNLHKMGMRIVDATCPKVKKNQLKIEELSRAGYYLFLAGDADHAEIEGILGYAEASPFVVVTTNAADAEKAAATLYETNPDAKTALLGQTTISEKEYSLIGEAVRNYFPDVEIINSICDATKERQNALRRLLEQVEAVIIAGSKDSANTGRLLAIAQESGKPCVLVENCSQIPAYFQHYKTVGLSAGASTPDSLIVDIELEFLR